MGHYSEEDLILHYFGEGRRRGEVEQHLEVCPSCAATYRSIADTLHLVAPPDVPARDDAYPLEVWQRLSVRLPKPEASHQAWFGLSPLLAAAAAVVLVATAFLAGRMWSDPPVDTPAAPSESALPSDAERVRMVAIGDHLEQSERLLLDLVNAGGDAVDMSDQQSVAADLIDAGRFYRDASTDAGDRLIASVLEDLERSLLDVVHGPSTMTPEQLDEVRTRVDAAALLFKVRVLADELRDREPAAAPLRKTT